MYDFDKIIPRENTSNVKYDLREAYFGNTKVLPMWVADMDFETPDFIRNAVFERAKHPIYGYSFRNDKYNESIINWQKRRFNWEVDKEWLVFNPGVVPALNFSIHAYTKPGDGVLVQPPVYFPFFNAIKNNHRKLIENQLLLENGKYEIDFEDLEKKSKEAKMMFFCSPHNPVGRCWTKEELTKIANICLENEVVLVSDEIHNDLILPGYIHTTTSLISDEIAENSITCIAPSKTFNMAGLATSTIIIKNDKLRAKFQSVLEKVHITNGNLFGMVASQAAYESGDQWLSELLNYVQGNFDLLKERLNNEFETLSLIDAQSTYLAWIDFRKTGMTDDEVKETLINKAGLGLNNGAIFGSGGSGFQRMNLATPRKIVNEGIDRLKAVFS